MTGAGTTGPVAGSVLSGMVARVSAGEWGPWSRQVERAGFCWRPVRLRGRALAVDTTTGEIAAEYSTGDQPDGSVLVACKDRRAAVCGPCAETYRRDVWHLVASGLRGRSVRELRPRARAGAAVEVVPGSVAAHPVVFATFTAPGFGAVHAARDGGRGVCRERRGDVRCRHGLPVGCSHRHAEDDGRVGDPLCWGCYDYDGHVLWHAAAPALWARTIIYLYRALARLARLTVRAVRQEVRVSYVKVAEWQRRAAVHFHAVLRLDGVAAGDPDAVVAPPAWADAAVLEAAMRDAVGRAQVPLPAVGGGARAARWGAQLDVTAVADPMRTAAYVAKYATKTAGDTIAGLPVRAFGRGEAARVREQVRSSHVMLLVAACLRLSKREDCAGLRLADNVHALGFGGHYCTKSRHYSVTLGALRQARRTWRAEAAGEDGGPVDPWAAARGQHDSGGVGAVTLVGDWRYAGSGFTRLGDADLAATLARDHAAWREHERDRRAEDHAWRRLIHDNDAIVVGEPL
ncbi:replication initiator [Actinomadura rudentiformis]|uniref:replication initiator n=1 Tax=Actinomadura rudentiformis TaxID=359158 RepID=UPI00178C82AE|nr:replication initiator [Actinomadura rudentiformis]